jgi:small conductance mechanosensitive channel
MSLDTANFQNELSTNTRALSDLGRSFLNLLPGIVIGILVFTLFFFISGLVKRAILRTTRNSGYGQAVSRLARLGVLLGGLLVSMAIAFPTVNGSSILSALGVSGVAIGFAFRDILQNYFAGILLLWREPFKIGDQIVTSNNFEGTVEGIEMRATFIRTYDGRRVVIPNSSLFIDSVTVNTAFDKRRLEVDVGIGYGDDIETARRVIVEVLGSTEGVLQDPSPDVLIVELADFSVILRARYWTRSGRADELVVQDRVLTAIKKALTDNGIDLPFPTQQVLFHDQTEETDGDRARQREGWPAGKQAVPRSRYNAARTREETEPS